LQRRQIGGWRFRDLKDGTAIFETVPINRSGSSPH
jgi:hypothetical protein